MWGRDLGQWLTPRLGSLEIQVPSSVIWCCPDFLQASTAPKPKPGGKKKKKEWKEKAGKSILNSPKVEGRGQCISILHSRMVLWFTEQKPELWKCCKTLQVSNFVTVFKLLSFNYVPIVIRRVKTWRQIRSGAGVWRWQGKSGEAECGMWGYWSLRTDCKGTEWIMAARRDSRRVWG